MIKSIILIGLQCVLLGIVIGVNVISQWIDIPMAAYGAVLCLVLSIVFNVFCVWLNIQDTEL